MPFYLVNKTVKNDGDPNIDVCSTGIYVYIPYPARARCRHRSDATRCFVTLCVDVHEMSCCLRARA